MSSEVAIFHRPHMGEKSYCAYCGVALVQTMGTHEHYHCPKCFLRAKLLSSS